MPSTPHARRAGEREQIFSPYLVWIIWLLWLFFLYQPISALVTAPPSLARTLSLLGLALYVGLYLWITWQNAWRLTRPTPEGVIREPTWREWGPITLMLALGVGMIWVQGQIAVGSLIYVSAALCARLSGRRAALAAAGLTLLTIVLGLITHSLSAVLQIVFIVPAVGLFVYFFGHAIRTNQELRRARQEIARLAISEERLRFARDLHDLLGHTLSLIALKSELARRLVNSAPEQAASEIGDIETAARQALTEVREAVAAYRQPTLTSELSGAGELLSAAGVAYRQHGAAPPLAPAVEAALAWAVREGVTNIIRHSHARACDITLSGDDECVRLAVRDDGADQRAAPPADAPQPASAEGGGSGLAGLRERVTALGGVCESGPAPAGGWRLLVTLPLTASAPQAADDAASVAQQQESQRAERRMTAWFG